MNTKNIQSVLSAGIITAVIFLIDLSLPRGVAIGVLYVTVLFLLPDSEKNKNILLFAAITSFLTLLAFFIKGPWATDLTWKNCANRGISIFTIWVMAGLMVRYRLIQGENQEKIRKNEERFRSLVGSAKDAIVTSDERGNILTWNHSAARIFG